MLKQLLRRAAKKTLDYLRKRVRPRFLAAQFRLITPRSSRAMSRNDLLARQSVHNRHNRGVRARTPLRKSFANIAHRAFLHSPQRRHAIQLQRSQFQNLALPRSVASIRLCRHIHRVSFARFVIVLDAAPGFWLDALAFPKSPPVRPACAGVGAAGTAVRAGTASPPLK